MTTAKTMIERFSWSSRMEHWVQMISFVALAITGLVQRYDGAWISEKLISGMSGIEVVRDIHRVFATAMMVAVVYHFGAALYRKIVLDRPRVMIPSKADATAVRGSLKYLAGRADAPPPQGRFSWEEKVEYWAFVWGTVVMVISGFLLWNPIATTNIFPGEWVPTAKVIHSGEATLAVLAIIVWHIYHVHIAHFNTSMFTGKMSRHEMEEFHPLELASIDANEYPTPPLEERRRRMRRFVPVYSFMSIVLLFGIYLFVSFEETAIATIKPAEQVEVFVPVETLPPTSTTIGPATTTTTVVPGEVSWDGVVAAFFSPSCTGCHGTSGGLDLASYEAALAGGDSGPGIVPGNSTESVIAQVMASGSHPGLLSDEDLATFTAWIDAGAAESSDATTDTTTTTSTTSTTVVSATWDGVVAAFFTPSCTGCHGTMGGLDLSSYDAAVAGGVSGAGIVPGNSAESVITQKMAAGDHPGLLSDEDLATFIAWIDDGAAESSDTTSTTVVSAGDTWDGIVAGFFTPTCTGCHGTSGGLDLSSYEAAVAGGGSGPGIVPGDPGASMIVRTMAGSHPGLLSDEDLAALITWIEAGAAEN
ncbi:MAG: cytochrome b/b6 domain-containing protein [Acidimicrobiia bacterium]|nr:cytochrome b/b6 domain-containing protein [Acidimicrobiia bacterium]